MIDMLLHVVGTGIALLIVAGGGYYAGRITAGADDWQRAVGRDRRDYD